MKRRITGKLTDMARSTRPTIVTAALTAAVLATALLAGCTGSKPAAQASFPPAPTTTEPASATAPPGEATLDDWPTYHHDNARSGVGPAQPAATTLRAAWLAKLDGAVYGQPLVVGDRVLAATENDTVYALDRGDRRVAVVTPRGHSGPAQRLCPAATSTRSGSPARWRTTRPPAWSSRWPSRPAGYTPCTASTSPPGQVKLQRVAEPPKGDRLAHQQRAALTVFERPGLHRVRRAGRRLRAVHRLGGVASRPAATGAVQSYAIPTTREGGIWAPGGGVVLGQRLYYAVGNGESTLGLRRQRLGHRARPHAAAHRLFAPLTWAEDNARDLDLGSMTPAWSVRRSSSPASAASATCSTPATWAASVASAASTSVCEPFGGAAVSGRRCSCRAATASGRPLSTRLRRAHRRLARPVRRPGLTGTRRRLGLGRRLRRWPALPARSGHRRRGRQTRHRAGTALRLTDRRARAGVRRYARRRRQRHVLSPPVAGHQIQR